MSGSSLIVQTVCSSSSTSKLTNFHIWTNIKLLKLLKVQSTLKLTIFLTAATRKFVKLDEHKIMLDQDPMPIRDMIL